MKQLLLLLCILTPLFSAWNPVIRRDDRLDRTIRQLSSRYDIPMPDGFSQQPMHREPVVEFLRFAHDSVELTAGEITDVALLLEWYEGDRTLFSRSNEQASININLDLTGEADLKYKDSVGLGFKGIIAPAINGHIGGISFSSQFMVLTEARNDTMWQRHTYQAYQGNPFNLFDRADSGDIRASDEFRAGASWNLGLSKWDFGVDNLKSGPVVRNALTLNLQESPAAYIRMGLDFPWFNYTHIALVPQTLTNLNRHMMYHRIEIPFASSKFKVGINETVVYGSSTDSLSTAKVHSDPVEEHVYDVERSFEPVYAIPFIPFVFAEHFTGDRDNALLSFDFSLNLPTTFQWYLEFILDDISAPHTLFNDDWGNKWGLTVGGSWFGLVANKNLTLSTEYSRIEPWVYTHFKGASHRYSHYGSSIGSNMGPNTDVIWTEAELQLNQKHRFSISFENLRWNHEYRGGSIDHVFISENLWKQSKDEDGNTNLVEDSETKEFLSGNVQSDQIVTLGWDFLPYHLYEMESRVSYSSQTGLKIGFTGGFQF